MGSPKKVKKLFLLAHKKLRNNKYKIFLIGGLLFSWASFSLSFATDLFSKNAMQRSILGINNSRITAEKEVTLISPVGSEIHLTSPTPRVIPSPTPTPIKPRKKPSTPFVTPSHIPTNPSQYTAEKINDVTWRVKDIENDDRMANRDEIVSALNSYRKNRGQGPLIVDGNLSSYASDRANLFASNGSLDSHAGFRSYMDNGGFDKAGFNSLGENSAFVSGPMSADKIVRQIFGADASHDSNQLDNWTHVGVGVNGNAINVNFGKGKR